MFNFLTTLCNAAEHSTIKKVFGSYENAAIVDGNINLLHKLQDEKLCNSHFIEPEEQLFTLDMILGKKVKRMVKQDEEGIKQNKQSLVEWFNSLSDEEKALLKELNK